MPTPLNDPAMYKKLADDAYAKRGAPKVTRERMAVAEGENITPPPISPAAAIPGVKFTKGFSPEERALQQSALLKKLKASGDL
jgi:hypothetical protein